MYLLKNAKILDAETNYARFDVLVDGSKIVETAIDIAAPDGCTVIDLEGYTLMPCFVDAHVHAGNVTPDRKGFEDSSIRKLALMGVSLCKDDGILASLELEPYLEFLAGCKTPNHARVVTAGRYIDVEGGYGMGPGAHMGGGPGQQADPSGFGLAGKDDSPHSAPQNRPNPGGGPGGTGQQADPSGFGLAGKDDDPHSAPQNRPNPGGGPGGMPPGMDGPGGPGGMPPGMDMDMSASTGWGIKIETAEEAADAVTYQFNAGTDGVKIGIADNGNQMTSEQIKAITDRAKSHGMWTTAHVGTSKALQKLVDGGIGEAAHTPGDRMPDSLIAQMVAGGVSMITTVGDFKTEINGMDRMMNPGVSDEDLIKDRIERRKIVLDNLKRFADAGGVIAIGTDLMNSDEKAKIPVSELRALSEAGLELSEVIRCGTANAVAVCGLDDEGYVREGLLANLIAIPGELDERFEKLDPPVFVMNQGVILRDDRQ